MLQQLIFCDDNLFHLAGRDDFLFESPQPLAAKTHDNARILVDCADTETDDQVAVQRKRMIRLPSSRSGLTNDGTV